MEITPQWWGQKCGWDKGGRGVTVMEAGSGNMGLFILVSPLLQKMENSHNKTFKKGISETLFIA